MIADPTITAASENLRRTYFELGRSAANSRVWEDTGFRACVGDIDHPICNFAAGLDLDRESAQRLARVALERRAFNVYATPIDRPRDVGEILVREGFQRSYRLVQMVAEPGDPSFRGNLVRARTHFDRMQISYFMVDQFFSKQAQKFRQQVAEATSRAVSLELLALKRDTRIVSAAMVSFNCGIAGVYNVCVDSSLRGLGLGTTLMREILAACSLKGAPATLQCDAKLERWYSTLGFTRTGCVDVYVLPKPNGFAIMQAF